MTSVVHTIRWIPLGLALLLPNPHASAARQMTCALDDGKLTLSASNPKGNPKGNADLTVAIADKSTLIPNVPYNTTNNMLSVTWQLPAMLQTTETQNGEVTLKLKEKPNLVFQCKLTIPAVDKESENKGDTEHQATVKVNDPPPGTLLATLLEKTKASVFGIPLSPNVIAITAFSALLASLIALILIGVVMWKRRNASRRSRSLDDEVRRLVRENLPTSSSQQLDSAQNAAVAVRGDESLKRISDLGKKLKDVENVLSGLSPRIATLEDKLDRSFLRRDDFRSVVQVLRPAQTQSTALSTAGPGKTPRMALASVVNHWLAHGQQERSSLIRFAREVGLDSAFAANIDNDGGSDSGAAFECSFTEAEDGSWLLSPVAGTDEVWVCATEARLLDMGNIPYQLRRLFEGMEDAKPGFRFKAIFRPCCLQRSGGKYILIERGAIQLEGMPSPSLPMPAAFETYRVSVNRNLDTSEPGKMLSLWIQQIDKQLNRYASDIETLTKLMERPGTAVDISEIQSLRRTITQQTESILNLKGRLARLESPPPTPIIETSYASPLQVQSVSVESVRVRTEKSEKAPATAVQASAIPLQVTPPSAPLIDKQTPAIASEAVPVVPSIVAAAQSSGSEPPRVSVQEDLPSNWTEALVKASTFPGNESFASEMPSPELYVLRLCDLVDTLGAINPDRQIAIVHVKKDGTGHVVELHETETNAKGDVECKVCRGGRQTWQLFVSCNTPTNEVVYLFLPLGLLRKGNFAAGYSALIEDTSDAQYSVREYQPAQLRLLDAGTSSYGVVRKLILK